MNKVTSESASNLREATKVSTVDYDMTAKPQPSCCGSSNTKQKKSDQ